MLVVGLTGGIGSGKSTVSAALAERGAVVVDADAIVRDLQAPGGSVLLAMVERFGPEILRPDGSLDRQRVADRVFVDPAELEALNAIVHPAVGHEIRRRVEAERSTDRVVVLDVPLLAEKRGYETDGTIVVDVDPETAVRRLVESRGFGEADARARIARQASREERLAMADFVISNDGTFEELQSRIDDCWAWISQLTPQDRTGPVGT
ncbi:MAG TPA: dephospho-CoA kinase [Acidimicrobiales bacterium]